MQPVPLRERNGNSALEGSSALVRTFSVCQPVSAVLVITETVPSEEAAESARPSSCGAKDSAFTLAVCAADACTFGNRNSGSSEVGPVYTLQHLRDLGICPT